MQPVNYAVLLVFFALGFGLAQSACRNTCPVSHGAPAGLPPSTQRALATSDWVSVVEAFHEAFKGTPDMAPTAIRVGFHLAITWDAKTKTGGTNGGTFRIDPKENKDVGNKGISVYTNWVDANIKPKFTNASFSDLYTLGAAVAVPFMGGPPIHWRPGRIDKEASACASGGCMFKAGMLPEADLVTMDKTREQCQGTFERMGFGKREMVVLLGAHTVGRMHLEFSKFEGIWTVTPLKFNNAYYRNNIGLAWKESKSAAGQRQFVVKDKKKDNGTVMLLADLMLAADSTPDLKKIGLEYARSKKKFFTDFAPTYSRLLNNGVPVPANLLT